MYRIKDYSYNKAMLLGVHIFPSENLKYKIEVYDKKGNFICYIGDAKKYLNNDYPTYLETHGKEYAEFRRSLYKKRHHKEADKIGSRGYYAYNILW